jgi:hypothetical protein
MSPARLIFRPEALRRYAQSQDKIVSLRFLAPPKFRFMWFLLCILLSIAAGIFGLLREQLFHP